MNKVFHVIDTAIKYLLVVLVAVLSVLGIYQVIGRALGHAPAWTEESIRFLFVWATCVGAAVGVKEHIHIGIDVLVKLLPNIGQKIMAIIVQIALCVFDVFLIRAGAILVQKTMNQPSPAMRLPMGYVYLAVPVLGGLGLFYSLREIVRIIREKKEEKDVFKMMEEEAKKNA